MADIETFDNPHPYRDYEIIHINNEFTSLCPKTGLPDFGKITLRYIPDKLCIELKSLKYYYLGYRNQGIFYEDVTNQILNDLVEVCHPRFMEVISEWTTRGGMNSKITVQYKPIQND
ncbi:MAG TPA: preQ(1) synthase [Bacteroidota bacterium]|nr:preQ(1) synthase [Candidatus Kapabacteria bacterium]HRS01103.1 preQ(1) synthase [Bacteroidota bacterium]